MNLAFISGIIHTITPNPQRKDWLHIVVRYGPTRAMSGHQVEFLNAVMLEVPAYLATNPVNRNLLKPDMLVDIRARVSGRARIVSGVRFVDNMPVVDAIERVGSFNPSFVESAVLPPLGTVEGTSVPLGAEGSSGNGAESNTRNLMNVVLLSGYLLRAIPSGKREPGGQKKISSATLHVQMARNKDDGGYHVNEAMVRLSEFLYPKLYRTLIPGRRFDLICHYQGVLKSDKDVRYIDNEIVADKVALMWNEKDAVLDGLRNPRPVQTEDEVPAPAAAGVETEIRVRPPKKPRVPRPAADTPVAGEVVAVADTPVEAPAPAAVAPAPAETPAT